MKRIFLTYSLILITFFNLVAQNKQQDSLPTSTRLFFEINFGPAIPFYKQMVSFDPQNPVFYYKLGFAYLNTRGKADSALFFFDKALKFYKRKYHKQINKHALKFYKAYAFILTNQADSAAKLLGHLLEDKNKKLPASFLRAVKNLKDTLDTRVDKIVKVRNLGPTINSKYTEHSPVFIKQTNTLIFTSRRPIVGRVCIPYDDGQYDENIFLSTYNPKLNIWSKPKLWSQIDTIYNQASCSYNPENQIFIFYKDEASGNLYWTRYINSQWSIIHKFPRPINTNNEETHATITADGKILYFAAYRPNTIGEKDIWMSKLLPDGTWSRPINLGPTINTVGDEDAPFITPDGKHLYFSSTGHNSLGGYDIFVSEKDEYGSWGEAQNLGYPINTIYDDIFFYPVDSATAYFASNRPGGYGHSDIYKVDFLNLKKDYQINICYLSGFTGNNNLVVKISDYFSGENYVARPDKDGKFIFVTKPNHKYHLIIENSKGKTLFQKVFDASPNYYMKKWKIEHNASQN